MPARPFLFDHSQAGVFHVVNRIYDRKMLLDPVGKDFFLGVIRAYEAVCGVEVLTFCLMDNHFHLLVRVPHRPEGFDLPFEVVVARLEKALGVESAKLMHKQLDFWRTTKNDAALEDWRRRQEERMFSLSEFMKAIQLRFSRWYNLRNDRRGTLWERRYVSVIVEEEERALRTMAAYIDLNPVRAGVVADPGDYLWSGYGEAMAGMAPARRGLVRIVGQVAWPRATAAQAKPWGADPFPAAVEVRALVIYMALLGGAGRERTRADGTVVRRGLSQKVRERLASLDERGLATEVLRRRVQHFTRGVMIGSRAFVDGWFESHREVVKGASRTDRKRGSRPLGKPLLRGLYAFRDAKS
jgi:REP element-mobilizing transposase RayT